MIKRGVTLFILFGLLLAFIPFSIAEANTTARVRVVHASPDAPAVDVFIDGQRALTNIPYKRITDYATLPAGTRQVQVAPTGTTNFVISANLNLQAGMDYTVVATGQVANIRPLVLTDDNSAPAAGKAKLRVVHASPNTPAVDIAVAGGPVLVPNISFGNASGYLAVDAGTVNVEARPAGTTTAALSVPNFTMNAGRIYTVFAVGLFQGNPALEVIVANTEATAPSSLPRTGDSSLILPGIAIGAIALLATGYVLRRRIA